MHKISHTTTPTHSFAEVAHALALHKFSDGKAGQDGQNWRGLHLSCPNDSRLSRGFSLHRAPSKKGTVSRVVKTRPRVKVHTY